MRVALLGCGKQKAAQTCAASMMYRSGLFQAQLRFALTCDLAFILSARHGLLALDAVIEPYDEALPRDVVGRKAWGARVARQLDEAVPDLDAEIVVLAGERYADVIVPEDRDWNWEEPLRGMGVGDRIAWLKREGR